MRIAKVSWRMLCAIILIGSLGCSGGDGTKVPSLSPSKAITAFSIVSPAAEGSINENAKTIAVTVPHGTQATALIATFSTTGAAVKVGSVVQVSGSTANDFTNPVAYDVIAENGSRATYTVTVTVSEPQSTAKAMTAFSIAAPPAMGIINEGAKTISMIVPKGTDRTALTAVFTTTGASVQVGGTLQQSGSTTNDFTSTVLYTITAADGSTATYSVRVLIQNYVDLQSDAGDYIGGGKTYAYTQANARIVASATGNHLSLNITGDQDWWGDYQAPNSVSQFQPGTYNNLTRYPFNDPAVGGLSWWGEGRGCNNLTGWFVIDSSVYVNGNLTEIDLHFEQHCEGGVPALHGQIHWTAYDTTVPAGPVDPPPAGLWQPAPGNTPTTGNYVYLKSDVGDYIGAGRTYTYTQADAQIVTASTDNYFSIRITGDQDWTGDFQAMSGLTQLEPGYYGNLQRYPFHNPTRGGLSWSGEGRGCNTLTGWFVVDNVTYSDGILTAIDLRFEQHCEGGTPSLHGQIHLTQGDATAPAGPVNPPPAGLWEPVSGSTPTTGNYVYLKSDVGDYIGAGRTYTYTQADARIVTTTSGNYLSIGITGDQDWTGDFRAMNSLSQFEPGYYGNLQRYPFHNPVRGGLSWSGEGRGCNNLTGWFVVDNVTYSDGILTAIDLRFEQHCEGGIPALHGKIHLTQGDTTAPAGPVNPPPAGLWEPVSGSTPTTGNYVYLKSDVGDYIGAGQTYTYTPSDSQIAISSSGGLFTVNISAPKYWTGDFRAMSNLGQLEPGYYGNLQRYPFHNPTHGGLSWYGDGRGCNNLTGWFVVDNVTYSNGALTAFDLRFEQHCEGGLPALHGQIHWTQ